MTVEQEVATAARSAWERLQRGPLSHDGAWSLGRDLEPVVAFLEDLAAGTPVEEGPAKVSIVDTIHEFIQAMDQRMSQFEQQQRTAQQQLPPPEPPPHPAAKRTESHSEARG